MYLRKIFLAIIQMRSLNTRVVVVVIGSGTRMTLFIRMVLIMIHVS